MLGPGLVALLSLPAAWVQSQPAAAPAAGQPPASVPVAQWTATAWLGVLLYVALFLLAAWWIYRLADIDEDQPA